MLDELDGTGGSSSYPPGTPEYHKVRLEMEQIHVSSNCVHRFMESYQELKSFVPFPG